MQQQQLPHQPQGHLGLKSSLYAIGNSKLITQRLIQDHMSAHYKNLVNAKPAIDTKIPKSALTSVKARDSRKRKTGSFSIAVSHSRPNSAVAGSTRAASQLGGSTGRNEFSDELQSILSSRELAERKLADDRRSQTPTWSPSPALSLNGPQSTLGSIGRPRSTLTQSGLGGAGVIYKTGRHRQFAGDHLDRFAERFKENGEFQPRLLKKAAQSWLAASKHYVPPRQYRSNRPETTPQTTELATPTNSEASTKSRIDMPSSQKTGKTSSPSSSTRKENLAVSPSVESTADKQSPKTEDSSFSNAKTAFDKINDDGCVKFISEVTQDILDRGVFTNRAIENILMEHYAKNKGKLNERKLQLALSSLREDFGLNETGHDRDAFISATEQYYSPPVQPFKISSVPLVEVPKTAMLADASRTKISEEPKVIHTHAEPVTHSDGADDLNKTVDELIAKINELETRPNQQSDHHPKEISEPPKQEIHHERHKLEDPVGKTHEHHHTPAEETPTSKAVEHPTEVLAEPHHPASEKPEPPTQTESSHLDEGGDYEEDFE